MCPVRQIPSHLLWTYREHDTPYEVNLIHKDAMLSSDMLTGSVPPKFKCILLPITFPTVHQLYQSTVCLIVN